MPRILFLMKVSKYDVSQMMSAWTSQRGYPVVTINLDRTRMQASISVSKLTWFHYSLSSSKESKKGYNFPALPN